MTLEPNLSGWSVISPSMLLNHAERNGIEAESESARIGDQEYRRVRAAPEPPRTLVDYWQLYHVVRNEPLIATAYLAVLCASGPNSIYLRCYFGLFGF